MLWGLAYGVLESSKGEKMTIIIQKDWVQELAKELADQSGADDAEKWMPETIRKHVPLQDGVAYMPVPRCDGCKHWERSMYEHSEGSCVLTAGSDGDNCAVAHPRSKAHASVGGDEFDVPILVTNESFGCVQWERQK